MLDKEIENGPRKRYAFCVKEHKVTVSAGRKRFSTGLAACCFQHFREGIIVAPDLKKKSALQTLLSDCGSQRENLRGLAQELVIGISGIDPSGREGMLDLFISELVLSAADQRRKNERRQHQMECIAAAKARGVRFGPERKPLPDNFEVYYEAWQNGEMTTTQAAQACGMSRKGFCRATERKKQDMDRAV